MEGKEIELGNLAVNRVWRGGKLTVIRAYARADCRGGLCFAHFGSHIKSPIRRREVLRKVQEASDAASQSLGRLFLSENVPAGKVRAVIKALSRLREVMTTDDVATATYSPDALLKRFLPNAPAPKAMTGEAEQTLYRVALQTPNPGAGWAGDGGMDAGILGDLRRLADEPNPLGYLAVETTPDGIRALAQSRGVRAILEDQAVRPAR